MNVGVCSARNVFVRYLSVVSTVGLLRINAMILSGELVQMQIASDVPSIAANVLSFPLLGMVAHASPVGVGIGRFASNVRRRQHEIAVRTCIHAKIVSRTFLTLRRLRWCVPRVMRT